MASSKNASETNLTIAFLSNTDHMYIYWCDAFSTINPFKQLKCALESKLLNFKIFKSC